MKRAVLCMLLFWGCGEPETAAPPCEPRPFDADFAEARDPASPSIARARSIADRYMRVHPATSMAFDWGEGVLMLSLVDLYRVTGDTALRDYVAAWLDHHIAVGYVDTLTASDRCPPAASALALYAENCRADYREMVDRTLHYLYEEALRDGEGGINHLGTVDLFGVTLWLDSLFMFGTVLTRWGAYAADDRALDEQEHQIELFASHLQDAGGLLLHAFNWGGQDPNVFWARGNSWVTAAAYEYLGVRPDEEIRTIANAQASALVALQDPATGLWWTVLNRPGETYLETSASALFAAGLARGYRVGALDAAVLPNITLALQGIESRLVDQDGPVVTGISGPTTVGDFDHYASIELGDDIHYGVGAVILALVETSGL
jgi:unsaturated rhamnogalacturonyl hydrolase